MEERHSDMVSEVQRERVLSEVVSVVFCDFDDFIPNTIEQVLRKKPLLHQRKKAGQLH